MGYHHANCDTIVSDTYDPTDHGNDWRYCRTDRNGTRHYVSYVCPKCGGSGAIEAYSHVDGGVCYLCNGSGKHDHYMRVYTKAYGDKLNRKRFVKACEKFGLADDGSAWVVCGDTYAIRGELKAAGAHYMCALGWYFSYNNPNYDCCKIDGDMIVDVDTGYIIIDEFDKREVELIKQEHTGIYGDAYGAIGERCEITLTLDRVGGFESAYGYTYAYSFVDVAGRVFVWKTTKAIDTELKTYKLKATIKDHRPYRGVMQTVITRCKIL